MSKQNPKLNGEWNPLFLKEMSLICDKEADDLIQEIMGSGGPSVAKTIFESLRDNDDKILDDNVNQKLKSYFNDNQDLPLWADESKIKLAQDFFAQNGPAIAMTLNLRSLPLCYSSRNGAKVLYATGKLNESPNGNVDKLARRLLETSQMVMNVMVPGGFESNGKGIITVKKVRLMHAAVRFYIKNPKYNPNGWDAKDLGEPINQEEMAGTLMAFSALIISGLVKVGIKMTDEEKDAYMHCWNIVGHFIGVDTRFFPNSYNDGWNLGISILRRNLEESMEGKALTKSLIDFNKDFIPGHFFDELPEYFVSHWTEDVAKELNADFDKVLNLEEKNSLKDRLLAKLIEEAFEWVSEHDDDNTLIGKMIEKYNVKFLQTLVNKYFENKEVEFDIPPGLKSNWKLN